MHAMVSSMQWACNGSVRIMFIVITKKDFFIIILYKFSCLKDVFKVRLI